MAAPYRASQRRSHPRCAPEGRPLLSQYLTGAKRATKMDRKARKLRYARFRRLGFRGLVAAVSAAVALIVISGVGSAGAETPPTGVTDVVHIEEVNGGLRFVAPPTVHAGDELEILNETNPRKVGPHTFSMVTKGSIPKTSKARQLCFTPNHICKAVAGWHGVKGEGAPTKNPATAGAEGWSTMGSLHKKGDSWFTGTKPKASFTQRVSVDTSGGPQTFYFMCAIHPWMHGKITVLPAGS
jgi:hypothetical protein